MQQKNACALSVALWILFPQIALAQLERTYVATTGSDANACQSPANACRFLPRALQQTDPHGTIVVLDTGAFAGSGPVITQSVSIVAVGVQAELGGSGVNTKITINAGPDDVIYLDGLNIFGLHPETNGEDYGIRFNSGGRLHVRKSRIRGFRLAGILLEAPGPAEVVISDSTIIDNQFGIRARRLGGSGVLQVLLDRVTVAGNVVGVRSHQNVTHVRLSDSNVVNNGTGLLSVSNGRLISLGNNVIRGNGTNGAPTHNEALQ
jgi:hypothetical protein